LHLRRHVAHLAFGDHLAAALHQARQQILEPSGRQEMPGAQLGGRSPFLCRRHQQRLVMISDRFVRQFHGHAAHLDEQEMGKETPRR
jgi:hypothetical protein